MPKCINRTRFHKRLFVRLPPCLFKAYCGLEDFIVADLVSRPGESEAPKCHALTMQLGAISKLMG